MADPGAQTRLGGAVPIPKAEDLPPGSSPARPDHDALAAAYDALACGVLVHDASGALVYANPAAAALVGVSVARLRGRTPLGPIWAGAG